MYWDLTLTLFEIFINQLTFYVQLHYDGRRSRPRFVCGLFWQSPLRNGRQNELAEAEDVHRGSGALFVVVVAVENDRGRPFLWARKFINLQKFTLAHLLRRSQGFDCSTSIVGRHATKPFDRVDVSLYRDSLQGGP